MADTKKQDKADHKRPVKGLPDFETIPELVEHVNKMKEKPHPEALKQAMDKIVARHGKL